MSETAEQPSDTLAQFRAGVAEDLMSLAVLHTEGSLDGRVFQLPRREFRADLIAWIASGALMVVLYHLLFDPYAWTGVKVLIGCAAFGIFGGMFNYLGVESRIIATLARKPLAPSRGGKAWSVSRKMFVLIVMVLSMMKLLVLLLMHR